MAIGAAILFLGSTPFWRGGRNDNGVWDFTHKLWSAVLFTVAGALIYVIGIFAISAALSSLFSVNISRVIEHWLLPIGLGFLAPMAWLSMLPAHDETDEDSLRHAGFISRAVGFLGAWILAPLTLIYAFILIAYGVKIVLTQSLPNGEIAALVTPFLIIGTLTWLVLDPPFIRKKRLARLFRKAWFVLMIPAALLLAVAVFVRIGEYGWTVERYLLILATVWALGVALWFTLRKEEHRDIRIIPGFAALLLAFASFGPWGADGFSAMNQSGRLHKALMANDMLDEAGRLKPQDVLQITNEKSAHTAKGALNYLVGNNQNKRVLRYIGVDEKSVLDQVGKNSLRFSRDVIQKRFGLDEVRDEDERFSPHAYISYTNPAQHIAVRGYDFISAKHNRIFNLQNDSFFHEVQLGDYEVSTKNVTIRVVREGETLSTVHILDWLRAQDLGQDKSVPPLVLYAAGEVEIALYLVSTHYTDSDTQQGGSLEYRLLSKGIDIPGD